MNVAVTAKEKRSDSLKEGNINNITAIDRNSSRDRSSCCSSDEGREGSRPLLLRRIRITFVLREHSRRILNLNKLHQALLVEAAAGGILSLLDLDWLENQSWVVLELLPLKEQV